MNERICVHVWVRVHVCVCACVRAGNTRVIGGFSEIVEDIQVCSILVYGAETWALKKAQENKLEVVEIRILQWMCGVTKLDKIRNDRIRGTTKVGEIAKKVQERRLRAFDEKRVALRRKEGDGNESTGEEDERKA